MHQNVTHYGGVELSYISGNSSKLCGQFDRCSISFYNFFFFNVKLRRVYLQVHNTVTQVFSVSLHTVFLFLTSVGGLHYMVLLHFSVTDFLGWETLLQNSGFDYIRRAIVIVKTTKLQ